MVTESLIEILNELKEVLLEEKNALIQNENNRIQEIVGKKEALIEALEQAEVAEENKEKVRIRVYEIQELQKTNAMLTEQAMNYASVFITAFQKEAQKNTTYSKEGSYEKAESSKLFDQSL